MKVRGFVVVGVVALFAALAVSGCDSGSGDENPSFDIVGCTGWACDTGQTSGTDVPVTPEDGGVHPADGSGGDVVCVPNCDGRECGDDGCGGSCGAPCPAWETCIDGVCGVCTPDCTGRECGSDGCTGSCGECGMGEACEDGTCLPCEPDCTDKECGSDGCGDPFGCGTCPAGEICESYTCVPCTPDCTDKECGDDGCGGTCGSCEGYDFCQDGTCHDCIPQCNPEGELERICGDDGCGSTCGECGNYSECNHQTGRCEMSCIPNCAGRACGPDGCGNTCGTCDGGLVCNTAKGTCGESCEPYCPPHRECGGNGCGGSCADHEICAFPTTCEPNSGRCVDECVRQCEGRECGDDGCGGRCAYCPDGEGCNEALGVCEQLPLACAGIWNCSLSCANDDTSCKSACSAAGRSSSVSLYNSVVSCAGTQCSGMAGPSLNSCVAENCPSQLSSCNLDFLCGDPGLSACGTVSSCMGSCADGLCLNNCLCEANEASWDAALAYAQCLVQNCPGLESDCVAAAGGMMMGACMMQWMNCFGM